MGFTSTPLTSVYAASPVCVRGQPLSVSTGETKKANVDEQFLTKVSVSPLLDYGHLSSLSFCLPDSLPHTCDAWFPRAPNRSLRVWPMSPHHSNCLLPGWVVAKHSWTTAGYLCAQVQWLVILHGLKGLVRLAGAPKELGLEARLL